MFFNCNHIKTRTEENHPLTRCVHPPPSTADFESFSLDFKSSSSLLTYTYNHKIIYNLTKAAKILMFKLKIIIKNI